MGSGYFVKEWGPPVLVGVPFDANSSFLRGAAEGPKPIREALHSESSNMTTELGVDLSRPGSFSDDGDLTLPEDSEAAFAMIEKKAVDILGLHRRPFVLGGDHSITYPLVRSFAQFFKDLTVIQFDAHPDLYNDFDGNRYSHASPFARIMEDKLARRLIQVGVRTMTAHQRKQAERFGVEVFEIGHKRALEEIKTWCPVYISFDMDVLDPAFAPGVSHREPGGMTMREVLEHLHSITAAVVGADVVEYNPKRDVSGLTADVAGKVVKEILGKMVTQCKCP